MPSLELTIEDTSPIITYSSNWRPGTSADDPLMDRYSQNSFTVTNVNGESVSFSFNGTGVQIFGAKRGNHGPYHVNLDKSQNTGLNGTALDPGLFQTSLFSVSGLQQGPHQVTLTNDAASYVDIDFITWQTDIGAPGDNIIVDTFKDTDPSFVYSPSDGTWTTNPSHLGTFLGGTGHATNSSSASFTYTFKGIGVSLYGPTGPNGSSYAVQLDGRSLATLSSTKSSYRPQTLLYHANNLEPGVHNLQLQCQSVSSTQLCAIDYATVYSTSSQSGQSRHSLSIGAVAGITAASLVTLFLLLGLLGLLWFRVRHQPGESKASPSAFGGTESTVGDPARMTTVVNPFVSSPSPPSSRTLPYNVSQFPHKGQVRFIAANEGSQTEVAPESTFPDTSSSAFPMNASSSTVLQSTSHNTRPRSVQLFQAPITPGDGDGLPPGYSA